MQRALPQILIVDDDDNDVFFTKRAIRKSRPDCRIAVAADGNQAIDILVNINSLQLILLDLKMPGIGGIEILLFIKDQERLKHIPVIVISSSTMERDIQESYNAGAAKYIHKSHDLNEFTKSLTEALDIYLDKISFGIAARGNVEYKSK